MEPPKLCPQCNAGYIKYSGGGTEKAESELARLFPQALIRLLGDKHSWQDTGPGIYIATQSVFTSPPPDGFYLTCCLSVDNTLNHVDFRSAEKAFDQLTALRAITTGMMVIQTKIPDHYVLAALASNVHDAFYAKELSLRVQLDFPPVRHFCLVRCRGKVEEKVCKTAQELFSALSQSAPRTVKIVSVNAGIPPKLRGNFHWNILISTAHPEKASSFLKKSLKKSKRSGIIVTVDMDPV
jgi:primosomal protein N' (replication factor Y)